MQIFDYLNKEGLLYLLRKIMGRDVDISQADYDSLPDSKNSDGKNYYIYDSDITVTAEEVGFDGSTSGSAAANSQQALDELFEEVKDVNSNLEKLNPFANAVRGTLTLTYLSNTFLTGTITHDIDSADYTVIVNPVWGGASGDIYVFAKAANATQIRSSGSGYTANTTRQVEYLIIPNK